jgi:GT2 family glycosyltransferase
MPETIPVAVIIPTYGRGQRVFGTLKTILQACPAPAEVWVHVDESDGTLEKQLSKEYPSVHALCSKQRLGPGGGRHRCLERCQTPYAASFDDDSYPADPDFFGRAFALFESMKDAAVLGAKIWRRDEVAPPASQTVKAMSSFTGCGHVIRVAAYRQTGGYVTRPVAYGLEELDVSLRLFASGWRIYECGELRVHHDTDLMHHKSPEITEGGIANVALLAFLRYPVSMWGWGLLQLGSMIRFNLRRGRWSAIPSGVVRIPWDCWTYRKQRSPLPRDKVREFLRSRRAN